MDRIREAVKKARTDLPQAPTENRAPIKRFDIAPQRPSEKFVEVKCDFEGFAQQRIISNEQDPVLNSYRVLRTRVLQKMEENGWKTIAIVSPGSGAGKSVTAINLAIAIGSKQGSRATLVDLDFYRPRIAKYLGIREHPSVLDFFENGAPIESVTVKPDLPDVLVLANERVTRRGAELLTSAKADELIARTVNDFGSRAVIFDMSPMIGCDDTIAFLPKVDCVLLVAASGLTRVAEFKEAKRMLANVNIVGTLLNKAPGLFQSKSYYY